MTNFERENIRRMMGYTPGAQPAKARAKLNTNENPYPPSVAVMRCLREVDPEALRRYPDPSALAFRTEAARLHGLDCDHIIATNGGDELLRLAITTFLPPGVPLGIVDPSYSLYPVLAAIHDNPICAVSHRPYWSLPADTARIWNDAGARLAMIVNPHAPSGRLTTVAELAALAATFKGVLLIDEAYVDFVDPRLQHDTIAMLAEHQNVLLLRSMSKGYSLAGLRLGYGIGSPTLIAPMLAKTKDSYNVDVLAQMLGVAALRNRASAALSWNMVRAERDRMERELRRRGLPCMSSQTNFLLAQPSARTGLSAENLFHGLAAEGIHVRWFDQPGLGDKLRITIGTAEENDLLLETLDRLIAPQAAVQQDLKASS